MFTRQIATGAFAVLAMVLTAAPARSATTGAEYLDHCRDADQFAQADFSGSEFLTGWCYGFTAGVTNAFEVTDLVLSTKRQAAESLCIPDGGTITQIVRVSVRHIEEHPERQHEAAAALVMDAIAEAFPCAEDAR